MLAAPRRELKTVTFPGFVRYDTLYYLAFSRSGPANGHFPTAPKVLFAQAREGI
jgi:hypothetical protein